MNCGLKCIICIRLSKLSETFNVIAASVVYVTILNEHGSSIDRRAQLLIIRKWD